MKTTKARQNKINIDKMSQLNSNWKAEASLKQGFDSSAVQAVLF